MNLSVADKFISSLMAYVSENRTDEKSHIDDYQDAYKCVRWCSSTIVFSSSFFLDGGRNTDEVLQGSRKFKVETYIPIIDSLVNNVEKCS
jgi:hypothetical protein